MNPGTCQSQEEIPEESPEAFAERVIRPHVGLSSLKQLIRILHTQQNTNGFVPYHQLRAQTAFCHSSTLQDFRIHSITLHIQCQILLRLFLLAKFGAKEYEKILPRQETDPGIWKMRQPKQNRIKAHAATKDTIADDKHEKYWIQNITALFSLVSFSLPPGTNMADIVVSTIDRLPPALSAKLAAEWKNDLLDFMEIRPKTNDNPSTMTKSNSTNEPNKPKAKKKLLLDSVKKDKAQPFKNKKGVLLANDLRLNHQQVLNKSRYHLQRSNIMVPTATVVATAAVSKPKLPLAISAATTTGPAMLLSPKQLAPPVTIRVVHETPSPKDLNRINGKRKASQVIQETPPERHTSKCIRVLSMTAAFSTYHSDGKPRRVSSIFGNSPK